MNPSTDLARSIVDGLIRLGVREIVLAPGSRNAPLAFAAYDAATAGHVRLHTRIDERSAGFLALGLSKVGPPAAVVCTSGTAVANLHPAVLEAAHAAVGMIVVTADRPSALRGTSANQTTAQVGIFGPLVETVDVAVGGPGGVAAGGAGGAAVGGAGGAAVGGAGGAAGGGAGGAAVGVGVDGGVGGGVDGGAVEGAADRDGVRGGRPALPTAPLTGPWHLNVQLAPPLMPDPVGDDVIPDAGAAVIRAAGGDVIRGVGADVIRGAAPATPASIGQKGQPPVAEARPLVHKGVRSGPRTVVVAGDDAGPPARVLAQEANWPLLAEPTSGSRTGANVIRCYRLLLEGALGARIERVVVAGHPTLSRPVTRLLERADVEVIALPARGIWAARPFAVDETLALPVGVDRPDDPDWLDEWRAEDRRVARELDRLVAAEDELTPYAVAGAVSRALPPEGLLFVGASSPIRDLDLMVAPYAVGDRRKVIANRGLSGIDGTVSSAVGAALGRRSSRSLALMGDLTFLHDGNGLIRGPEDDAPDLTIVVVNDDGGSIFSMLEQGDAAYADRYERLFGTPHGVDLASLCAATRTPHWRVDSLAELEHALANPNGGVEVIEARVRRDNRRTLDERIRSLGR